MAEVRFGQKRCHIQKAEAKDEKLGRQGCFIDGRVKLFGVERKLIMLAAGLTRKCTRFAMS
jgi:hypothetical protein